MTDAIVFNLIAILLLSSLGAFFAPFGMPRWFAFLWVANLTFWLSAFGWIVYVAIHFLSKVW